MIEKTWPISPVFTILLSVLVAAVVVSLSISSLVQIARKHAIVDNPNPRKLNTSPVPVLGGVGVFLGMMVATIVCASGGYDRQILYLFAGMLFMLYIGVCDDITNIRALKKLGYQLLAVVTMVLIGGIRLQSFQGLFGIEHLPFLVSVLLTIFYSVGILNAINLIDGVDGLASGYGMLVTVVLGICFELVGDPTPALLCFATFGALFPFFLVNVFGQNNKMYIGDAGSLILGMLFATLITLFINHPGITTLVSSPVSFLLALFTIPVFDTLRVMAGRMLKHQSPFAADKTHLHHILLGFGFSHARVTVIELCLTAGMTLLVLAVGSLPQTAQLLIVLGCGWGVVLLPGIALTWYKKRYAERIEARRMAADHRKRNSALYRIMRRVADGKTENNE